MINKIYCKDNYILLNMEVLLQQVIGSTINFMPQGLQ